MLFNSIDFAFFLPLVFIIYWFAVHKNLKIQNLFIVLSSYVFYGWWDWRFLSLLLISTALDYAVGRGFAKNPSPFKRKLLLLASLAGNLGLLGFFKYYNFFVQNFADAFTFFGYKFPLHSLSIILPVGISFYTFQTLSYSLDLYKRKLEPTKDFIAFSAYVSFFPQLVAGPIERATRLLPQFFVKRRFDYAQATDGCRQILWGFFKKMVIADNCAQYANMIFNNYHNYNGSTLLLGAMFFTFQIYCDFSGYSDIAIGTARLFGFELMRNFNFPYFSRDIAEFWRKWHISLSTWFRDYLYIPLGGSEVSTPLKVRNTFIIFLVSGFWHGANWTFIAWGALNAIYFLPLLLAGRNRVYMDVPAAGKIFPSPREALGICLTFALTLIAWIFFRAENMTAAFDIISGIFSASLFNSPAVFPKKLFLILLIFNIIEWLGRDQQYAIAKFGLRWNRPFRWAFYYIIVIVIWLYAGAQQQFIYFQF
jgi:D-alanyl-lipoteichoic acid acyltransferase DltB (MBOAT superfamily)